MGIKRVGHGEMRNAHKILVGEPSGKRKFPFLPRRREENIKMGMDWIFASVV
jgi:hypothetical protein